MVRWKRTLHTTGLVRNSTGLVRPAWVRNELLAIIVGHGSPQMSALDVANLVLDAAAGVHGLIRVSRDELGRVKGVGGGRRLRRS